VADISPLLALAGLLIGLAALATAITRNYKANRGDSNPYRDVLERIVDAANDPNARGLETALADAEHLVGRRT
jgi:hypothetical protein